MSLDMRGHIDGTFRTMDATRTIHVGSYVGGIWVESSATSVSHDVTLQALTDKEIQTLSIGGERINEAYRIYINDGETGNLSPSDTWQFNGLTGTFKAVKTDNRPWRNYCKVIVSLQDE